MPSSPASWTGRLRAALREEDAGARYEIRELIGRGAAGAVYRAFDRQLRRPVAIKRLHAPLAAHASVRARFDREARAAARLSHPNVVAVHDVTEAGIVMELADGESLRDVLEKRSPTLRRRVALLEQAARGVAAAHARGIVHRDLKPANIIVRRDGVPKVADFGLAREEAGLSSVSDDGAVVGTPLYMAPEQIRGRREAITARTDVYALGAMLYEMMAGRPPHASDTAGPAMLRALTEDPPPVPGAPPDLEAVALRALQREPDARYASAHDFADDLKRWLDGAPVLARPAGFWRRARRHGLAAGVLAALLLAVSAGTLLASQARRRAEGLGRLVTHTATIADRRRDLRQLRSAPERLKAELADAVRQVDAHIAAWPGEPQGWYVRACGRLALGDRAGAERDARESVARRSEFRPGWSLLGRILLQQYFERLWTTPAFGFRLGGEPPAELRPTLELALAAIARGRGEPAPGTREDEVADRVSRAAMLWQQGRQHAAIEELSSGMADYEAEEYAFWTALLTTDRDERLRWLDRTIQLAPGYAEARFLRGSIRALRHEDAAALEDLDVAVRLSSDPGPRHNRSTVLARLGRHEEADADLARVQAWGQRAARRWERGDLAGALADFNRLVALHPGDGRALNDRACVKARMGDTAGALADFERAIDGGNAARALANRGVMKRNCGDAAAAVADFDRSLDLDPAHADAWFERGQAKRLLGDSAGALADLERAIELQPENADALFARGWLRNDGGRRREAEADFTAVLALHPGHAGALLNRGSARLGIGDGRGALADFERAGTTPEALLGRGGAREILGDAAAAAADYEAALASAPAAWPHRAFAEERLAAVRRR